MNYTFTNHAIDRMLDMDVDPAEVRKCLESPRYTRASNRGDGRRLYFSDRITAIVQEDNNTVVTVVWRTETQWERDLSKGEYGGRQKRSS